MNVRDGKKGRAREPVAARPIRTGTVAIIGRANVGKSTLLNAALGQPLAIVSPTPQTTRDAILGVVRHADAEIALLDTPGLHKAGTALGRRMNQRAREAAKEADLVLFVIDVPTEKPARPSKKDGPAELPPLRPHPGDRTLISLLPEDRPTVLVVNKIDRIKRKDRLFALFQAYGQLRSFAAIVPISALREDGVDRVLDQVAALLPEGEPRFGEDDLTDRPVRFFAAEYVREQILRSTVEEVPHATAVVVDRFVERPAPEAMAFIDATIHVERAGQKKILIGEGASMLKRIGTQARERIEELLGYRVTLKLWVRVTPNWRESEHELAEFGYGHDAGGER